jgi:hypothetical protein
MSQRALLLATRDQLRASPGLKVPEDQIQVTYKGRPYPMAGPKFIGVWAGYWRDNGSNGLTLDELYGINVTVSVRMADVPSDRLGVEAAKANDGLIALCEQIRALIHMDPEDTVVGGVMWRANAILGIETANGFIQPLQFLDGGSADEKSGAWWGAKGQPMAGLAQTVSFGSAERVQNIESQA